jgi:hypothetical protein
MCPWLSIKQGEKYAEIKSFEKIKQEEMMGLLGVCFNYGGSECTYAESLSTHGQKKDNYYAMVDYKSVHVGSKNIMGRHERKTWRNYYCS